MTTAERKGFSLDEWSDRWGICRQTAYNLRRDGKLTISKVGSRSIITAAEDERFESALEADGDGAFKMLSRKRQQAHQERLKLAADAKGAARKVSRQGK